MKKLYDEFTYYCVGNGNLPAWASVALCIPVTVTFVLLLSVYLTKGWILVLFLAYAPFYLISYSVLNKIDKDIHDE